MRAIENLNSNLKIGTRVGGGFAVVLALLVTIAATAFFGLTAVESSFHSYSMVSTNVVNVQHGIALFETSRRNVRTYVLTAKESDLKAAHEYADAAQKAIGDYISVVTIPENKQIALKVSDNITKYMASVDQVAKVLPERKHMVDEVMRPLSTDMRAKLTAVFDGAVKDDDRAVVAEAGSAVESLMFLQINSLRYLLFADPKSADAFEDTFKTLTATVGRLAEANKNPERAEMIRKFTSDAEEFATDFRNTVKMSNEIARITDEGLAQTSAQTSEMLATLTGNQLKALEGIKEGGDSWARIALISMLVVAFVGLAFGCVVAWLISRGISHPVIALSRTMKRLTAGDLESDVPGTARGDEIGEMAKAVLFFRDGAVEKKKMETEALATAAANLRIRSALDSTRSNVMLADNDYKIIYVNATMLDMMREAESEIRRSLPHFDASRLIGHSVDSFFEDPAQQRRLWDGLAGADEMHLGLGGERFHLVASPIVDINGKRAGIVVEWRKETAELAIQDEVDRVVKEAVAGDLTQRLAIEGKQGFMLKLSTAMNDLCGNFEKFVAEVGGSAREVNSAAAEISASTTDLSQRTEEQAASLEQTSASMEQISATVKKNADNAQRASQLTSESRDIADRGGAVVADAVKAMARIEESSRKIADIIGVIDEIARQTNLLALNAAVEAARAGDAGRGFAVVASEVRSLAQRSSQAAKDIKDLITNSSGQVKDGVGLVNQTGASLNEIVSSIKQVVDIVADIATASSEQSEGLGQINKALAQMDEVTQQNSALVEENAASAKALEQQSTTMHERVGSFKVGSDAHGAASRAPSPEPVRAPVAKPTVARPPVARPPVTKAPAAAGGAGRARPNTAAPPKAPVPARPAAKGKSEAWKGPVDRMQAMVATAFKQEPDWKEF